MRIKRDDYLNALISRMHNGMIKVVTGIRRAGKSYLLFEIFRDYLLESGVPSDHVIMLSLDDYRNREYRSPDMLLGYIDAHTAAGGQYYVMLDEVQFLTDFEEVLISLTHMNGLDLYVTGSNSRFLSHDIITEFRGRGDEIHVFPLSFSEFLPACGKEPLYAWEDYITYGGLPAVVSMPTAQQKTAYLARLFEETYLKDIIERNRIAKTQELEDLINVLASSVGSLTNPPKIRATFASVLHSSISLNTIRQYIEYLKDAFLIAEARQYDVKGRKYIGSPYKFYFEDIGLRNARLQFRQNEPTHLMENVIYNELRKRGYQADVGIVEHRSQSGRTRLEVDFVANLGNQRVYIQSAYSMPDAEKRLQEERPLTNIGDAFRKIIITRDSFGYSRNENGIVTIGLIPFLLDPASLSIEHF